MLGDNGVNGPCLAGDVGNDGQASGDIAINSGFVQAEGDHSAAGIAESETLESVTVSDGPDNDALFEAWITRMLPGIGSRRVTLRAKRSALSGRASLDGINLKLYDALVPMIREVAEGNRTSTWLVVSDDDAGLTDSWWTAEELGLESLNVRNLGPTLLNKPQGGAYLKISNTWHRMRPIA